MAYDYLESIKASVYDYLKAEGIYTTDDLDELKQTLNDDLWAEDSVTGNGSGSYTFSREEARENLEGNMELLVEAMTEFGCMDDKDSLLKALTDPEWGDVTIRCYLLAQAIDETVNEMIGSGDIVLEDEEDE